MSAGAIAAATADGTRRAVTPTGDRVQQASLAESDIPAGAAEALTAARADLQQRLALAADAAIIVMSVDAIEWPDASLGCPEPGKVYAQAIRSGYLIVLGHAGATYEYHTSTGSRAVLCVEGAPATRVPD